MLFGNLKILNNVKYFLWKGCNCHLLHYLNLSQKGMAVGHWFLKCEEKFKDDWHYFFEYEQAHCFWANSPFFLLCDKFRNLNFSEILQVAVNELKAHDFKVFVVCVWCS